MVLRRVFVSVRLREDDDNAAIRLRDALEAVGVSAYLCDPLAGDNIATEIARALGARLRAVRRAWDRGLRHAG
jgi:hypothetical protein